MRLTIILGTLVIFLSSYNCYSIDAWGRPLDPKNIYYRNFGWYIYAIHKVPRMTFSDCQHTCKKMGEKFTMATLRKEEDFNFIKDLCNEFNSDTDNSFYTCILGLHTNDTSPSRTTEYYNPDGSFVIPDSSSHALPSHWWDKEEPNGNESADSRCVTFINSGVLQDNNCEPADFENKYLCLCEMKAELGKTGPMKTIIS